MKKQFILLSYFLLLATLSFSQGALKIRSDALIQIGYSGNKALSFGNNMSTPNNGRYAIEYYNGGLNFWRPWPATNAGNYYLFLRDDRNVGIGTQGSSLYKLDVNGAIRSTQVLVVSDSSLKVNVKNIDNSLDKILKLRAVTYNVKPVFDDNVNRNTPKDTGNYEIKEKTIESQNADDSKYTYSESRVGFIAQEVSEIFPNLVVQDENGILAVSYQELIPYLVESIKELKEEIRLLQEQQKK